VIDTRRPAVHSLTDLLLCWRLNPGVSGVIVGPRRSTTQRRSRRGAGRRWGPRPVAGTPSRSAWAEVQNGSRTGLMTQLRRGLYPSGRKGSDKRMGADTNDDLVVIHSFSTCSFRACHRHSPLSLRTTIIRAIVNESLCRCRDLGNAAESPAGACAPSCCWTDKSHLKRPGYFRQLQQPRAATFGHTSVYQNLEALSVSCSESECLGQSQWPLLRHTASEIPNSHLTCLESGAIPDLDVVLPRTNWSARSKRFTGFEIESFTPWQLSGPPAGLEHPFPQRP